MYENERVQGSDGEGPFVLGALSADREYEEPAGEAEGEAEYPEIYNEMLGEAELYEGPRHPHRRPARHHHPRPDADEDRVSRESPFLDEEEIARDLSGESMSRPEERCSCGRRARPAPPPVRRRPARDLHEAESDGGRPTLSRGSRGQAVLDLQSSLQRLGISPGPLDGDFGSKTDAAVRQFQGQRGIGVDGIVGPITWGEIDRALGGAPPSSGGGTGTSPGTGSPGSGPSGSAAAIVAEAAKWADQGYREGPNNDNVFSNYFGNPNSQWCGYFVSYVHTKAGIKLSLGSTDAILAYVKRINRFTNSPLPGDIVIFDENPADSDPATHVGIVERVSGSTVYTIEGNSSDMVARRKYTLGDRKIVGFGRLWSSTSGSSSSGSSSSSGGSTSAAPCASAKPRTTVNRYLSEFTTAAAKAGVPSSWAQSQGLIQLVGHESNWNPAAKNPYSSAFGLFQFIKDTWKRHLPEVAYGSTDPMWQAVGGYRYIKAAYGDPDRAWAFWQATVCKNASLAPADLQGKARTWISKGYAGY